MQEKPPFVNIQTHVIFLVSPKGRKFVVGTDKQRPFTSRGAELADAKLEARLPRGWTVEVMEIAPITEVLRLAR